MIPLPSIEGIVIDRDINIVSQSSKDVFRNNDVSSGTKNQTKDKQINPNVDDTEEYGNGLKYIIQIMTTKLADQISV